MNRKTMAACGLAVCLSNMKATPVFAFEQAGFQSGMTLAQAKEAALSYGTPLISAKMKGKGKDTYWIGDPSNNRGMVQFCDDRLFWISQNIPGEVHAFAENVEAFGRQYGAPSVSAASGHTQDGYMSYVRLEWDTPDGETVTVLISRSQERSWTSLAKIAPHTCNQ